MTGNRVGVESEMVFVQRAIVGRWSFVTGSSFHKNAHWAVLQGKGSEI